MGVNNMENICKMCKETISKKPKFIDINKIKVRMKLKCWFESPSDGNFLPCDGFTLIRKIDGDLIYYSVDEGVSVYICTRDYFTNNTEILEE